MKKKTSTLNFYKLEASGNDFVVVDNRSQVVKSAQTFTRKVCALHTGIGADGVLLLEKSRKADFKMRIINSDGSEAEACGNGFRCIAFYAHRILGFPKKFKFETLSGIIEATIKGQSVKVRMGKPFGYKERGEIEVLDSRLHYSFINTGVPHAVIFVPSISKVDVNALGRAIREHKVFKPKGTNVNFVQIKSKHSVSVRTYERGVEHETLACGTGSTASAVISAMQGATSAPVKVTTSGGEQLIIDFKTSGKKNVKDVYLEGKARIVFEGKIAI